MSHWDAFARGFRGGRWKNAPADPAQLARLAASMYLVALLMTAACVGLLIYTLWSYGDPEWLATHDDDERMTLGYWVIGSAIVALPFAYLFYMFGEAARIQRAGLPGDHPPILGSRHTGQGATPMGLAVGVAATGATLYLMAQLIDRAADAGGEPIWIALLALVAGGVVAMAAGALVVATMRRLVTGLVASRDETKVLERVANPVALWRVLCRTNRIDLGLGAVGALVIWSAVLLDFAASRFEPYDPTVEPIVKWLIIAGSVGIGVGLLLSTQAWKGGVRR